MPKVQAHTHILLIPSLLYKLWSVLNQKVTVIRLMTSLKLMDYISRPIVLAFGPIKRSWLFCIIWGSVILAIPSTVCAQSSSGSTVLRGSISKTVTLSLFQSASHTGAELHAFENGAALSLVVSGSGFDRNLQVPILIRSNISYHISASIQSETAVPTQLRVLSIEPSGKSVARDAVTGVAIRRQFDVPRGDPSAGEENLSTIDASVPFTIFSGPRISLGGGLNSPGNALKVIRHKGHAPLRLCYLRR